MDVRLRQPQVAGTPPGTFNMTDSVANLCVRSPRMAPNTILGIKAWRK